MTSHFRQNHPTLFKKMMRSDDLPHRTSEFSFSTDRRSLFRTGLRAVACFEILVKGRSPLIADSGFETNHPEIRKSWEFGLSVLKPSAAELEKGLRIHRDAMVFDADGFTARAVLEGNAMGHAAVSNLTDLEITDLRQESGMTRWAAVHLSHGSEGATGGRHSRDSRGKRAPSAPIESFHPRILI
jgi:hypothetical protein